MAVVPRQHKRALIDYFVAKIEKHLLVYAVIRHFLKHVDETNIYDVKPAFVKTDALKAQQVAIDDLDTYYKNLFATHFNKVDWAFDEKDFFTARLYQKLLKYVNRFDIEHFEQEFKACKSTGFKFDFFTTLYMKISELRLAHLNQYVGRHGTTQQVNGRTVRASAPFPIFILYAELFGNINKYNDHVSSRWINNFVIAVDRTPSHHKFLYAMAVLIILISALFGGYQYSRRSFDVSSMFTIFLAAIIIIASFVILHDFFRGKIDKNLISLAKKGGDILLESANEIDDFSFIKALSNFSEECFPTARKMGSSSRRTPSETTTPSAPTPAKETGFINTQTIPTSDETSSKKEKIKTRAFGPETNPSLRNLTDKANDLMFFEPEEGWITTTNHANYKEIFSSEKSFIKIVAELPNNISAERNIDMVKVKEKYNEVVTGPSPIISNKNENDQNNPNGIKIFSYPTDSHAGVAEVKIKKKSVGGGFRIPCIVCKAQEGDKAGYVLIPIAIFLKVEVEKKPSLIQPIPLAQQLRL